LETSLPTFSVTGQIVVRTVRNSFDLIELFSLLPFREKPIEQVCRGLRIMCEFLRFLCVLLEVLRFDSVFLIPRDAVCNPSLMPLFILSGHDEVLDLHLLEFADPKNEILWRYFIPIG